MLNWKSKCETKWEQISVEKFSFSQFYKKRHFLLEVYCFIFFLEKLLLINIKLIWKQWRVWKHLSKTRESVIHPTLFFFFVCKESKARQIFRKTNISYPLLNTRACACQGVRNVFFSENFTSFVFFKTSVLRFTLLPYYRRSVPLCKIDF